MSTTILVEGITFAVRAPANCDGTWRQCKARHPQLTEAQWHRGQMRSWAGFWRKRQVIAALVGDTVGNTAKTDLDLAKIYRDEALRMERQATPAGEVAA